MSQIPTAMRLRGQADSKSKVHRVGVSFTMCGSSVSERKAAMVSRCDGGASLNDWSTQMQKGSNAVSEGKWQVASPHAFMHRKDRKGQSGPGFRVQELLSRKSAIGAPRGLAPIFSKK